MNVRVTVTGLDKVLATCKELTDKKNYDEILDELGNRTLELARLYAPRKTGALEQSGRIISGDNIRTIDFSSLPYAWYMENGTIYFPVGDETSPRARTSTSGKPCYHPFLRPAGYKAISELSAISKESEILKFLKI